MTSQPADFPALSTLWEKRSQNQSEGWTFLFLWMFVDREAIHIWKYWRRHVCMITGPLLKHLSHTVYWTSFLRLCFSVEEAVPPLRSLKPEALQSPVTSSRSVDPSLPSLLIALCTTFTFYIFFFLRRVLDLGLFSCGWESSGRLLQGCRWIWSIWNMKQNNRCQAIIEASCIRTCMMRFFFYHSCVGGVLLNYQWIRMKPKRDFFFPPLPCSSHLVTSYWRRFTRVKRIMQDQKKLFLSFHLLKLISCYECSVPYRCGLPITFLHLQFAF